MIARSAFLCLLLRPGIAFETALKSGPVGWMNRSLISGCG
jgi:hypothetical protein